MTGPDAPRELSLVHLHRPPVVASPGGRAPLAILLHGVGSNERDLAPLADALDPRLRVLTVRSPLELWPGAYGWFRVAVGPDGLIVDPDEAAASWRRATEFVGEAVRSYDADPRRVYVGGFSQGGIVALAGLLTEPSVASGAFVLSGRLLPNAARAAAPRETLAGTPVLWLHGVRDATLPVEQAREGRERLEALGVDLAYRELPMGHEVSREALRLLADWLTARLDEHEAEAR